MARTESKILIVSLLASAVRNFRTDDRDEARGLQHPCQGAKMQQKPAHVLRGFRVVAEALRLEDCPLTKDDINYAVGDVEVPDSHGRYIPVRDVLDVVEHDQFNSAEEAVQAIRTAVDTAHRETA